MTKTIRSQVALVAVVLLAGTMGFAQSSGEATYRSRCQSCHGANGMADTSVGKAMKVKPISDPAVKKFTVAAMVEATKNGMGKMPPFKDKLTDDQIKASAEYFHGLAK